MKPLRREEKVTKIGAYYTPEVVADYLVSELNYVKPLQPEMRILDPCCGVRHIFGVGVSPPD